MHGRETEDVDDVFVENICTALFLSLGIITLFASEIMLVYSVIMTVYGNELTMGLLTNSIVAVFLVFVGFGSLQLFRRRRKLRKEKTSMFFHRPSL